MKYLDESTVLGVRQSEPPMSRSYGGKEATSHELLIGKQWHRVYVMIYSNSGTAYVFDPKDWLREHPNYRGPARRPARPRRRW